MGGRGGGKIRGLGRERGWENKWVGIIRGLGRCWEGEVLNVAWENWKGGF